MTIETILLILESVLLAATILLVLFSLKEGRGRRRPRRNTEHFSRCWEESMHYEDYLKEIVRQTGATSVLLAKELQIDEREIEGLLAK
jgi:hypothetical protein